MMVSLIHDSIMPTTKIKPASKRSKASKVATANAAVSPLPRSDKVAKPTVSSVPPVAAKTKTAADRMRDFEDELYRESGKDFDHWLSLTKSHGPPSEAERKAWLLKEHGLHPDYAWVVATTASGAADYRDHKALVDQMFAGRKAGLRPLYDRVMQIGLAIGPDVSVSYCRTQVGLKRLHNIIVLKPTTNTRLDVGLAVKGVPGLPKRLIDTGGAAKGDRITHRIPIEKAEQIDDGMIRWMRRAYELDAPRRK
ncbi:MAG: hypothetical protein H7Y88_11140 [Phycisphaerales bacterium]|nr:hypothetical protein [Phycisphaerales bacterium]